MSSDSLDKHKSIEVFVREDADASALSVKLA